MIKKIISILCALSVIVAGVTILNSKTAKADTDYKVSYIEEINKNTVKLRITPSANIKSLKVGTSNNYTSSYYGAEPTTFDENGDFYLSIVDSYVYTTVRVKDNNDNEQRIDFKVMSPSNTTFVGVKDCFYTGSPITQKDLTAYVSQYKASHEFYPTFKATYFNNTSVGKATVKITGVGDWIGEASTSFNIKAANATPKDTKKPTVKGVKNKKTYKKAVKIKFSDVSGIKKATLNGKKIKSGKKVKKKGKYTLIIIDKAGNKIKIKFRIK